MKSTPGPWKVNRQIDGTMSISGKGAPFLYFNDFGSSAREQEVQANAKLIAAAPELFVTLQYLTATLQNGGTITRDHIERALEVINKTT